MKIQIQKILFYLALAISIQAVFAQDNQPLPKLNARVTDLTATLSSSEIKSLENSLAQFEQEKGSRIAVLIIASTEPEAIEQYGIRLAEQWKVGRKNTDDGVILLVAKNDRKLRIEVGYGLEGAIPDIYAKRIIENIIVPDFRQGNFYEGIKDGTSAIISLINKEDLPVVTSDSSSSSSSESSGASFIIVFLIIIGFILKALIKNSKVKLAIAALFALLLGFSVGSIIFGLIGFAFSGIFMFSKSSGTSGGGRYYGGGGGFSSGGGFGGGFSGGGGGFGGGGASGGW